jgi:hypothetical protein
MIENPGIDADLVDLWLPYVIVFIIGVLCGATLENWARRSYFKKNSEIDESDVEGDSAS